MSQIVRRPEVPVLFVRAHGGPAGAPEAFERLEQALGGPRGRRFWGWLFREEYRACAVRREDDDPRALGLEAGVLAAGAYARKRHVGPAPTIHETFAVLAGTHTKDDARPDLEEYRREGEVWAYFPVPG